ncbi:unnamed protein product [Linum tenue]|uniref:Uncharacterized protein n=1 Tax=Linum tenue TaxID=586396 RepID=A0AAV0RYG4_9ROSI|nr:unnamed protein product [Linum tenue]
MSWIRRCERASFTDAIFFSSSHQIPSSVKSLSPLFNRLISTWQSDSTISELRDLRFASRRPIIIAFASPSTGRHRPLSFFTIAPTNCPCSNSQL